MSYEVYNDNVCRQKAAELARHIIDIVEEHIQCLGPVYVKPLRYQLFDMLINDMLKSNIAHEQISSGQQYVENKFDMMNNFLED